METDRPQVNLNEGDRIELFAMPDDPDPIAAGTTGSVRSVQLIRGGQPWIQVDVDWDNGRSLLLSIPPDRVRAVPLTCRKP